MEKFNFCQETWREISIKTREKANIGITYKSNDTANKVTGIGLR